MYINICMSVARCVCGGAWCDVCVYALWLGERGKDSLRLGVKNLTNKLMLFLVLRIISELIQAYSRLFLDAFKIDSLR